MTVFSVHLCTTILCSKQLLRANVCLQSAKEKWKVENTTCTLQIVYFKAQLTSKNIKKMADKRVSKWVHMSILFLVTTLPLPLCLERTQSDIFVFVCAQPVGMPPKLCYTFAFFAFIFSLLYSISTDVCKLHMNINKLL